MCGIVGYIGEKQAVPIIMDGLARLEYRGYDSAGLAVCGADQELGLRRAEGKLRNLVKTLEASPLAGTSGIGHTRWATHGRPTEGNAHPHRDCTGNFVVVHNGIVENYLYLKHQLEAEGHVFRTETDTEIIAHLIEKYFVGDLVTAVRATLRTISGVFAIAVISGMEPDKIVAARSGPPGCATGPFRGRTSAWCGSSSSGSIPLPPSTLPFFPTSPASGRSRAATFALSAGCRPR